MLKHRQSSKLTRIAILSKFLPSLLISHSDETPLRILLAEDNKINQRVVRHMVTRLGYQLDVVDDGCAAVEAATSTAYGVVLMDVQMPRMDGLEATRRIRAHFGDGNRPYLIALTASDERADCLAAGLDGYLQKPVHLADLALLLFDAMTTATAWRHQRGHTD